jgi:hypothetical protein
VGPEPELYGSCRTDFNASIDAAEAAGVVVVFRGGQRSSGSQTLRSPGNRMRDELNTFAIGALNQDNETAASFLHRGPSDCDGSTIKPEISAVGRGRSFVLSEQQLQACSAHLDGHAHVAGAVLLLRSAFPGSDARRRQAGVCTCGGRHRRGGRDNTSAAAAWTWWKPITG